MELEEFKAQLGDSTYDALVQLIGILDSAKRISNSVNSAFKAVGEKKSDLNQLKEKVEGLTEVIKSLPAGCELPEMLNLVRNANLLQLGTSIDTILRKIEDTNNRESIKDSSEILSLRAQLLTTELRGETKLLDVDYQSLRPESGADVSISAGSLKKVDPLNPRAEIGVMITLIADSKIGEAFKKALKIEEYLTAENLNSPGAGESKDESKGENEGEASEDEIQIVIKPDEVFEVFFESFPIERYRDFIAIGDEDNIKLAYNILEKSYEYNPVSREVYTDLYTHAANKLIALEGKPSPEVVKMLIDAALHFESFSAIDVQNKPEWLKKIEKEVKKSFIAVEKIRGEEALQEAKEDFYDMDGFNFKVMCNRLEQLSDTSHTLIPRLFELRLINEAAKKSKIPSATDLKNITNVQSKETFWKNNLKETKRVLQTTGEVEVRAEDGHIPESYEIRLSSVPVTKVKPGQIILKRKGENQVLAYYLSDKQEVLSVELRETHAHNRNGLLSQDFSISKSELSKKLEKLIQPTPLKRLKTQMDALSNRGKNPILVLTNDKNFKPIGSQVRVNYDADENELIYTYPFENESTKNPYSIKSAADDTLGTQLKNIILNTPPMIEVEDLGTIVVRYKETDAELLSEISQGRDFFPVIPGDDQGKTAKAKELLEISGLPSDSLVNFARDDFAAEVGSDLGSDDSTNPRKKQTTGTKQNNKWHIIAASVTPFTGLKNQEDDFNWRIAKNNHEETVFHLLLNNKKFTKINEITQAVGWLIDKFQAHESENPSLQDFLNEKDKSGNTALHLLCKNTHIADGDLVQLLGMLEQNGADLSAKDASGQTALHILCGRDKSMRAVEYLSDKINIDLQDSQGFTPLYRAVLSHQSDIVEYLIEKGANKNLEQTGNPKLPKTVQMYINAFSSHSTDKDIGAVLKERQELFNSLRSDIAGGDIESFKAKLKANKEMMYESDRDSNSLLHIAVQEDKVDIIEFLVEEGSNIQLPNNEGETPLDLAQGPQVKVILKNSSRIKDYRLGVEKELEEKEQSYTGGVVAGLSSLVVGSLAVAKISPKDFGSYAAVTGAVLATTMATGAVVWGVGRLGYECWHQYQDGADANISEGYILQSNFAKTWKELDELEKKSGIRSEEVGEKTRVDYLKSLEKEIVAETKKQSPNVVAMGENLVKADMLRKSLFKNIENPNNLIDKSEKLIEHFNKWREVQKVRNTSEGLNIFCDALKSMASAAGAAAVVAAAVDNAPVIKAAAIGGVAGGVALGSSTWAEKIRNPLKKTSERKV